ncbi:nuclear transport factor 2 family protein [Candidatus Obscuribacterales bacterium]|nr:nuclear transport factor 2 family protein [Candidatus Obscuribacterales bacterium]MBX3153308.1 nuclear transport factor 2 family protein [Candidatus Obscuribacterales bacterium]
MNLTESSNALNIALIENLIESVANLADNRNFESLESCFADEVRVDYTSAFGGEPELKQKQALMSAWASLLPGFDVTRHRLSNISVKLLDATHSTAIADVIADHHIGGQQWQVKGTYDYVIDKVDSERWVVRGMTFHLTGEAGSRDVLSRAMSAASTKPVSYLQRLQTMQVVREFLKSLEDKDMEKFASVWADDAVQEMPYSPQNFPKRIEGKANLVAHYSAWPENSGKASFTKELVFYPTLDPEVVFVEYHGVCEIKTTGRIYDQRYGGLFRAVNGKIKLFREYFDPNVFSHAFSLDER